MSHSFHYNNNNAAAVTWGPSTSNLLEKSILENNRFKFFVCYRHMKSSSYNIAKSMFEVERDEIRQYFQNVNISVMLGFTELSL